MSVPLPRLPVEAVQLLVTAESRQPLHSLIRGQVPQAEVRGSQCMTGVITQSCKGWRLDLEQWHKQRRGQGIEYVSKVGEWGNNKDRANYGCIRADYPDHHRKKKFKRKEYYMTPVQICSVKDFHEEVQPALPSLLIPCTFTTVFILLSLQKLHNKGGNDATDEYELLFIGAMKRLH